MRGRSYTYQACWAFRGVPLSFLILDLLNSDYRAMFVVFGSALVCGVWNETL